ncbi:hypothetical protein [Agrobacterium sp. CG674]
MSTVTATVERRRMTRVKTAAGWSAWVRTEDIPAVPGDHLLYYEDLPVTDVEHKIVSDDPMEGLRESLAQDVERQMVNLLSGWTQGAVAGSKLTSAFDKALERDKEEQLYAGVDGFGEF